MFPCKTSKTVKHSLGLTSVAALFFVCMFGTARSQLRPETVDQINKLVAEKQSRNGAERKISSRLLQAVRESTGRQMAGGVQLRPANVKADANGYFEADINAQVTPQLLGNIGALGGQVLFSSEKFHSIRARLNLSQVTALAAYPEVTYVRPAEKPHLAGAGFSGGGQQQGTGLADVKTAAFKQQMQRVRKQIQNYLLTLGAGYTDAQGNHTIGADSAKAKYGYEGEGIKVGVISDSYNVLGGAATDVAKGYLPGWGNPMGDTTPVTVVQDMLTGSDEGRAMLQVVHAIAPKAKLFFATSGLSDASLATNILTLRSAPYSCDIIVDDVGFDDEPVFEDGMIAQAVNTVTAGGGLYFSSAGNGGSVLTNFASVYEGDYNDSGSHAFTGDTKTGTIHNFGTKTAPVEGDAVINPGTIYTLNWADPLGGANNDYDLFLVSSSGSVVASSTNIQDGTQDPFEEIDGAAVAAGDQLVVFKTTKAKARAFHLDANLNGSGQGFKYVTTGQTKGHACADSAFAIAAANAGIVYPGVFTSSAQVEQFSADGPRRIFFNADSTPVTSNNFLFGTNGGTVRQKPDLTAPDSVSVSVTGAPEFTSFFYGTSCAAPHAAAVAALLKSAKPLLTTAQMRSILTSTALDIYAAGADINSGYGIVQPLKAMQKVAPTPKAYIAEGQVTFAEGSFSNHNGIIEPGETASVTVQLLNTSLANATGVTATLVSNTPGVTITQPASSYGNIAAGGNATNTATPFTFGINASLVPCDSTISFFLLVTAGGAAVSPQGLSFSLTTGIHPTAISSKLGSTASSGTGYTAKSGQQTGRLKAGTVASACGATTANPGLSSSTGSRQYDAYTFTNAGTSSQCVTATVTSTNGANIFTAAYSNSGFVATSPSTNFVADAGVSANIMRYSFSAPAGKKYTVVVSDNNTTPASGTAYTLNVSYTACATPPVCTPVKITTASLASGALGSSYKQIFKASGGSGSYLFSLTGGLPAGMVFNGDSLYGKPTQAGNFVLALTAADGAGCPAANKTDTLVVSGDAPVATKSVSGFAQTALKGAAFAKPFVVKVVDKNGNALSGVNVGFVVQPGVPSPASARFAGGATTAYQVTDSAGEATSPLFTADSTLGSFLIAASFTNVVNAAFAYAEAAETIVCGGPTQVTSNADNGTGTLRTVLFNACADATITFASGVKNITLSSGDLAIQQGQTIKGTGATSLTISGGGLYRVFAINAPDTAAVNLSGITITDGIPQDTALAGGGGVLINGGKVTINNCNITGNDASHTAAGEGGGVDVLGGTVAVTNSSIIQNRALYDGGGIALEGGSLALTSSTIAQNLIASGIATGGGIYCSAPLTLTNSTVYGNTGGNGANIYNYGTGTVTFKNTIIAGGTLSGTGGTGPDINGTGFVSSGYNLVQTTTGGTITGTTTGNITGKSPALLPLANYGGQTPTMLPLPTSPVVNEGDPSLTASQYDQRGYVRSAYGRADIGAVEANYKVTAYAGTPQTATVKTGFATALQGQVLENLNPISGVTVYFRAPTTGATGTFAGGAATANEKSNATGIAQAPAFTAGSTTGSYTVIDSIGPVFADGKFALTNKAATTGAFTGSITSALSGCVVKIGWQTEGSGGGTAFTLERSLNGLDYQPLFTPQPSGKSENGDGNSYTDQSPAPGANYYRVKQTGSDGSVQYSNAIIAVNTCSSAPLMAYPNPAHNTLTLVTPATAKQTVTVFNVLGRPVAKYVSAGGTINVDVSTWAGGVYTVSVTGDDKTSYSLKFVKN